MKISRYISGLFSMAMALLFLLTGSGIQLYLHQCETHQTKELSLYTENFSCAHQAEMTVSHQNHSEEDCCASENESVAAEEENCCHTNSVYYKINDDFNKSVESTTPAIPVLQLYDATPINLTESVEPQTVVKQDNAVQPPLFGFDHIITLHQLKIDTLA